jgi:hypothetical protein
LIDPSGNQADIGEEMEEEEGEIVIDTTPIIQGAVLTCLIYAELGGGGPCGNQGPKITLYHYTALPNVQKIITSGGLWLEMATPSTARANTSPTYRPLTQAPEPRASSRTHFITLP